MPLVNMKDMLQHAYDNSYAIGAFDLVSLDFLQGIINGAEHCQAPVILSLAESHFNYFDFELAMAAVEIAAKRASIPVAIHLDHGKDFNSAVKSINLGCNSIMFDASQESLEENIHLTRNIVDMAHGCGIPVEGELGYVPRAEDGDAKRHSSKITYTTVEDAKAYVEQTHVDFLAISIGTVHGRMQGEPKLDFKRLEQINTALKIPLVIHGGTGLSNKQFRQLINNGVTKINYYTALADLAGICIEENVALDGKGYTTLVEGISDTISKEVERCIHLWGSENRANDILTTCQPWLSVEHLIIYNVEKIDNKGVKAIMNEGRQLLSAIPGVREVITGEAIKHNASYRYTWLIRFCHTAVIDSFRIHSDHVDFADNLFRPIAKGRISIDYQTIESQA